MTSSKVRTILPYKPFTNENESTLRLEQVLAILTTENDSENPQRDIEHRNN